MRIQFFRHAYMKYLLSALMLCYTPAIFAQTLTTYTASKFSIGIPNDWELDTMQYPYSPKMSAYWKNMKEGGLIPTFNVNLIQLGTATYEHLYREIMEGFQTDTIVLHQDTFANGIRFKQLLRKTQMPGGGGLVLVYSAFKNGFIYQLTFCAEDRFYQKLEPLFKKIFASFKL